MTQVQVHLYQNDQHMFLAEQQHQQYDHHQHMLVALGGWVYVFWLVGGIPNMMFLWQSILVCTYASEL